MKVLVQRVSRASVAVAGEIRGEIGRGLLLFVGVERGDGAAQARSMAEKVATLRVFPDAQGRMNLDVHETGGACLVVSQFTLAGSTRRGRRPSFEEAAAPELARALVDLLTTSLRERRLPVETGVFAADMAVELVNDGPVTFLLEIAAEKALP
jgi:D-tyrosyl-tRNA(Tyr) deacylase